MRKALERIENEDIRAKTAAECFGILKGELSAKATLEASREETVEYDLCTNLCGKAKE